MKYCYNKLTLKICGALMILFSGFITANAQDTTTVTIPCNSTTLGMASVTSTGTITDIGSGTITLNSTTRGYAVFSLINIPANATITSDTLFLYGNVAACCEASVFLYGSDTDFSTYTGTGVQLYTSVKSGQSLGALTFIGTTASSTKNVLNAASISLAQANIGGILSIGFAYTGSATTLPKFAGEGSANPPFLRITYATPAPVPCSGMPDTGTITPSSASLQCVSTAQTLRLFGYVGISGLTYQWQSSPDGATWTNVGADTTVYNTGVLTAATYFRAITTCTASGMSDTTQTDTVITPVAPTVSISTGIGDTVCTGANVTFTATPVNGGANPSYQWTKNGIDVGSNSATYTDNGLNNNDAIICAITSSATCLTTNMATSNTITMTMNPIVTPAVSISSSSGNTICAGTNVTFTATPTNGGASPSYQWIKNGTAVGGSGNTYTDNTLNNNDAISCVLTSNAACIATTTATSDTITMSVTSGVTPAVSIASSPVSPVCAGSLVTFTATPNGGGSDPSYQWTKNGTVVGNNTATYTDNTLNNNDAIVCVLTSDATCATTLTATSNTLTMAVNPTVAPTVSISADAGSTICAGTSVTFTATPVNGGASPSYQWTKNGNTVGNTAATYTDNSLNNGDVIVCILTSNAACAIPTTATSNTITMTVNPILVPMVTIASTDTTICNGTSVTFTATPTNGGATPTYQWTNGSAAITGATNATYTSNSLSNNDAIACTLTSNATCAMPATINSNTITMTVIPTVTPTISISIYPGDTICAGTDVTFSAAVTYGGAQTAYKWVVNNNNGVFGNPTYSLSNLNNNYVVYCILTSTATCATATLDTSNSITMTVNPVIVPAISIVASNTTICAGTPVIFTATPVNGGTNATYQWTDNGTVIAGATNVTYSGNNLNNNDAIVCVLSSDTTCATPATVASDTIAMTVNPLVMPAVSISANPADTICAGTTVTFTAMPVNGGNAAAYQWAKNGTVVGTGNTYTDNSPANNDVIICELTSNATCATPDTANDTLTVTVNPLPEPVITTNLPVLSTGTFATYQWNMNGTPITGATNSAYAITQNGDYTVTVTDAAGCTGTSATDTVSNLAVPVIAARDNDWRIYPNPNNGTFMLEGTINDNSKEAQVEIMNVVGQVVYQATVPVQNGRIEQQLVLSEKDANGIYLLHINTDNGSAVIRLVVER